MCILLSAAEMRWQQRTRKLRVFIIILAAFNCCGFIAYALIVSRNHPPYPESTFPGDKTSWVKHPWVALGVVAATGLLLATRLVLDWAETTGNSETNFRRLIRPAACSRSKWLKYIIAFAIIASLGVVIWHCGGSGLPGVPLPHENTLHARFNAVLSVLPCLGSILCLIMLFFEVTWGQGPNRRTVLLLFAAWTLLAAMLAIGDYQYATVKPWDNTANATSHILPVLNIYALIDLIAFCLSCVVAIGWTADPNMLSLHEFYKFRLVRAYLGASNPCRARHNSEITQSVEGDDLHMSDLSNCSIGGPYQLINVTLNLAAGRDLSTVQRSSAHYLMSQLYCGCLRTGYRPTDRYMGGRLSLGTATAVSGAAASPNMGSKTPDAANAALLALLNVRLGYWAPTPNQSRWKSSRARLWPFYTMREFLSQTNDLSSYCYLTDGGHFDNTGLYALVQRGCRYIVVVDCGADPKPPAFEDLGDALRRCRIDFGTEFDLKLGPLIAAHSMDDGKKEEPKPFIVSKIIYSIDHARSLGWSKPERVDTRTGTIVWIKPCVRASASGDVLQYGFAHNDFPQQSTANQWFDEAQFESYRQLGQEIGRSVFGGLESVKKFATEYKADVFTPAEAEDIFNELYCGAEPLVHKADR
jgi:hypothetical protein